MSRLPFRKLAPDFFNREPLTEVTDPVAVAKPDDLTADLLDALTRDSQDLRVPRRDFWIGVIQNVCAHRLEHEKGGRDGFIPAWDALGKRHHHDLKGGDAAVRVDRDFGIRVKFLAHDFFLSIPVIARMEARRRRSGESGGDLA